MARVKVRELAEEKGYNISTLSRAANISYPTAHMLWHGQVIRVNLDNLTAVAKVLGVRTGDLIEDESFETDDKIRVPRSLARLAA